VRGPDAEAWSAGAGRRGGGAAWRAERLKFFRLALFELVFLPKIE
jgi:hypothetical protein